MMRALLPRNAFDQPQQLIGGGAEPSKVPLVRKLGVTRMELGHLSSLKHFITSTSRVCGDSRRAYPWLGSLSSLWRPMINQAPLRMYLGQLNAPV